LIPLPELAQLAARPPLFKLTAVTVKGAFFEQNTVASVAVAAMGPGREASIVKAKLPLVPALQNPFSVAVTPTVGEIDPAAKTFPAMEVKAKIINHCITLFLLSIFMLFCIAPLY
jgi:hypothetical protein